MIPLKSAITRKLLNYFFINPQESLYVNELCRKLQLDKRNLTRKLTELETEGVLKHEIRGNLKLYSINKRYPLYQEYKKIILKTAGIEWRLKTALKDTKGIKQAFIYGSYASDKMGINSDIDLLVVGSHSIAGLQRKISAIQNEIDREINVVSIGETEFKRKVKNKDSFLLGTLGKKHIRII